MAIGQSCGATVQARWKGNPALGDEIRLAGIAGPITPPRNPGVFDLRAYLARQDVFDGIFVRYPEDGSILRAGGGNPIARAAALARAWMRTTLTRGLEDSPDVTALISGMALGLRHEAPNDIEDPFQQTGTLHLFAVAGLARRHHRAIALDSGFAPAPSAHGRGSAHHSLSLFLFGNHRVPRLEFARRDHGRFLVRRDFLRSARPRAQQSGRRRPPYSRLRHKPAFYFRVSTIFRRGRRDSRLAEPYFPRLAPTGRNRSISPAQPDQSLATILRAELPAGRERSFGFRRGLGGFAASHRLVFLPRHTDFTAREPHGGADRILRFGGWPDVALGRDIFAGALARFQQRKLESRSNHPQSGAECLRSCPADTPMWNVRIGRQARARN